MKNKLFPALLCAALALSLTACSDLRNSETPNAAGNKSDTADNSSIGSESSSSSASDPTAPNEPATPAIPETSADQFECFEDNGELVIVKYTGDETQVNIPREIDGKPVTAIGGEAFMNCTPLTDVTIPDSVTGIYGSAFSGCTSLTSVTIPDSVKAIDYGTFSDTPWLENKQQENPLVIVNGILINGAKCAGSVIIPSTVTEICDYAFYGSPLTEIAIPNSVTRIGGGAFAKCTSLTAVTLPSSVTVISGGAFGFCEALTAVTIPNSVTEIYDHAFYSCTALTAVTLPDSVTAIGEQAFGECSCAVTYKGKTYSPDNYNELYAG